MSTTKRAAWNCPHCHATNVGARCGCTTPPTEREIHPDDIPLEMPPRKRKRSRLP